MDTNTMVHLLLFSTYFSVIINSVNIHIFRHVYAIIKGKKKDITQNGQYSCAFFVSSILTIFKLIGATHVTVNGTVNDLKKHDWKPINKPRKGCVIIWESIKSKGNELHKHIGFYIGNNKAISNSCRQRSPVIHHWTFRNKNGKLGRKIELMLWHHNLGLPR